MRCVSRFGRGVLAALALVVFEAGTPYGLVRFIGRPVPEAWPSWSEIGMRVETHGVPDVVLLDSMAVVVWLLWAYLTVVVVIELVEQGRNLPAVSRRALGPVQPFIAALVTTIVVSLSSSSRAPAGTAHPAPALAAVLISADPRMTPANAWLPETHTDAHAAAHGATPSAADSTYTVRRGDNLSTIAGRRYGDQRRWRRIWEANRGRVEPGHVRFTNPNRIFPGWPLVLPGRSTADPAPSPTAPPTRGASQPEPRHLTPGAGAAEPVVRVPEPPSIPAAPPPATALPATPTAPPVAVSHGPHRGGLTLPGRTFLDVGVCSTVVAALEIAWRLERRRRRVGQPAAGVVAQLAGRPSLRAMRRALVSRTEDENETSPVAPTSGPSVQAVDHSAPGRIPIGVDSAGATVESDLADLSGLAIVGPGAGAVATALILATLSHRQALWAEVLVVSPAPVVPADAAKMPGVQVESDVAHGLDALDEHLMKRGRQLGDRGVDDYREVGPDPEPPETLLVVVDPSSGTPTQMRRLESTHESGRRLGVAVITIGELPGFRRISCDVDGAVIEGGGFDGIVRFFTASPTVAGDVATTLAMSRGVQVSLPMDVPTPRAELAAEPPPEVAGRKPVDIVVFGGPRVLVDGQEVRTGLRSTSRALVSLLTVRPHGVRRDEAVEILWTQEGSSGSVTDFHAAIQSVRSRVRQLRHETGLAIIVVAGDVYQLDATVVDSDLWRFQRAVREVGKATAPEDRRTALEIAAREIGALPFALAAWEWADPVREALRHQAADSLVQLAELRHGGDDVDGAVSALEQACEMDPDVEELYQKLIKLLIDEGRPDAARRSFAALRRQLLELGVDPEPETEALLSSARHSVTAARTVRAARPELKIVDDNA